VSDDVTIKNASAKSMSLVLHTTKRVNKQQKDESLRMIKNTTDPRKTKWQDTSLSIISDQVRQRAGINSSEESQSKGSVCDDSSDGYTKDDSSSLAYETSLQKG
jgi:hypothetical protein